MTKVGGSTNGLRDNLESQEMEPGEQILACTRAAEEELTAARGSKVKGRSSGISSAADDYWRDESTATGPPDSRWFASAGQESGDAGKTSSALEGARASFANTAEGFP